MLNRAAARVSLRSRERKLRLFLELFHPGPDTTLVDVGVTDAPFGGEDGSSDNFFEALYPWPARITAVGHTGLERFAAAFPQVTTVQADGRELPFEDGQFDLGFSNAVVEHVAGGRAEQRRFVGELCRVAGRVMVTTPNRFFPVDPHSLLPFVHWLPERTARRAYRAAGKAWAEDVHLLTRRELAALFPGRVRVQSLGLTLAAIVD